MTLLNVVLDRRRAAIITDSKLSWPGLDIRFPTSTTKIRPLAHQRAVLGSMGESRLLHDVAGANSFFIGWRGKEFPAVCGEAARESWSRLTDPHPSRLFLLCVDGHRVRGFVMESPGFAVEELDSGAMYCWPGLPAPERVAIAAEAERIASAAPVISRADDTPTCAPVLPWSQRVRAAVEYGRLQCDAYPQSCSGELHLTTIDEHGIRTEWLDLDAQP